MLARIHGYNSPEEMIESVADITQLYVDPSRRAELKRIMNEQGFVKGFEIIMRKKDGSLHWVSNTRGRFVMSMGLFSITKEPLKTLPPENRPKKVSSS